MSLPQQDSAASLGAGNRAKNLLRQALGQMRSSGSRGTFRKQSMMDVHVAPRALESGSICRVRYFGVAGTKCETLAELLGRLDLCASATALGTFNSSEATRSEYGSDFFPRVWLALWLQF